MAATRGGYGLVPQTHFSGGLNLAARPDLTRPDQAIDLMNVNFLEEGGLQQRDGWQRLTEDGAGQQITHLISYYTTSGTRQLVAAISPPVPSIPGSPGAKVFDSYGASITSTAFPSKVTSYARFGAPGSELIYFAVGANPMRTWDGTAFATATFPVVTPNGRYLAVQAVDNRLVSANEPGFPDRVRFSDPGLPTTFQTNNYVDLRPGSGEPIVGIASWQEYVIVFKRSEFFVFYGNSTDSIGKPVFNYRPVSSQAGTVGPVAVAPEGVYFADHRGIWLTKGGEPSPVSGAIAGIFTGEHSAYFTAGAMRSAIDPTSPEDNAPLTDTAKLLYYDHKLYFAYSTNIAPKYLQNDRLAVLSIKTGVWTIFDIATTALGRFTTQGNLREQLVFGRDGNSILGYHVGFYEEGSGVRRDNTYYAGDGTDGVAITSRWRQGWIDYGTSDRKALRQTKLWGSGSIEFGISADYAVAPPASFTPVTFSASATNIQPWLVSRSVHGHVMSVMIRNSTIDKTWSLYQLEHGFRRGRAPEVLGRA